MATRVVVKKQSKLKKKILEDKKVSDKKKETKVKDEKEQEKVLDETKEVLDKESETNEEKVVVRRRKNKVKSNKSENIVLAVLVVILLASFAAIGFLFYKYFYAGASSNKYGDRLDGIENYPLPSSLSNDIQSIYTSEKSIDKVSVHVQGKIVYIDINYVEAVKIETAESLAAKALEKIGEENLKFYDVQYILTYSGTEENTNFPIFGAKKATSPKVVWSKEK